MNYGIRLTPLDRFTNVPINTDVAAINPNTTEIMAPRYVREKSPTYVCHGT